ncbi:hypothetical protein J2W35_003257 [Variovorax boronicumulans]|nr:hypothetical protein [Variovorax boronicumulans]
MSHEDMEPYSTTNERHCHGTSHLGSWHLQRMPHQRGCWYVQFHIRGMCVTGYAVQDDFGALQMVAV